MQDVHGTEKMCVCISLCMWTRRRDPTGLRLIPEADYLPFDEISLKLDLCDKQRLSVSHRQFETS